MFLVAGVVSFVSAFIAGLGGRLVDSGHLEIATLAAVLLLVPGVAVLNAQLDAIGGKPNLAAARSLRVAYILLFMTLGLVLAQKLVVPILSMLALHLLLQVFFGGAAAAGFGVLFNCPPRFLWLSFGFGLLPCRTHGRTGDRRLGPSGSLVRRGSGSRRIEPDLGEARLATRLGGRRCWLHRDDTRQSCGQRLDKPFRFDEGEPRRGVRIEHSRHRVSDARGVHPCRDRHSTGDPAPRVPGRAKAKQ